MNVSRNVWRMKELAVVWLAILLPAAGFGSVAKGPACSKISLAGEVQAGQEWKAEFGEGWVFRVVPVEKGSAGYSGWDLVVDRDPSAGYPDALLVATPPYYSISEREVGTTFGLRAQDAIGWNPRSFHLLAKPGALIESQKQFRALGGTKIWTEKPEPSGKEQMAEQ